MKKSLQKAFHCEICAVYQSIKRADVELQKRFKIAERKEIFGAFVFEIPMTYRHTTKFFT